ncbi:MAG TPA: LPS assembly protein LptD [Candidatus Sulfotelmatobacter sp.]|jgi:LPS-assembly protein|nr:LPS assembly protein LptD [Candidatus Sulfotelmatobacter sp.]
MSRLVATLRSQFLPRLPLSLALCLLAGGILSPAARAQLIRLPSGKGDIVEISADGPQKKQGDLFIADKNVLIQYGELSLRADHVEYNNRTHEAAAAGHIVFDYDNQHIEAAQAQYNLSTATGQFHDVRGNIKISRRPNPMVLVTDNPLYFEARDVDKLPGDVYIVRQAWITVCDREHPKWQFFTRRARIRLDKNVALVNANFRLLKVPLIWLPYATAPAGPRVRQSGFMIPDVGNSNRKGFILGDAFYWAPTSWFDTTLGAQYLSKRGSSQHAEIRATPYENTSFNYTYYGVIDRGLPDSNGVLQPQGGHQQRLEIQSILPNNWRFVTDYNQLSSLTFRLAFADAYGDAINSEVRSSVFLTNNFNGFSLNFAGLNDKSFLTINPETSVSLRNLPEARFGSVEQAPWRDLPVYFSFDSYIGGSSREDANLTTAAVVQRMEFAPRVTLPIHFGAWLGVTATGAFRATRYGASLDSAGNLNEQPVTRNDGEFTLEIRPPALERFFDRTSLKKDKPRHRYKHTIEPEITFRYVGGIDNFERFIRFDSDATLSNTTEVEYGITQRLFLKSGDDQPQELVSWRIVQKHYFDPTFGGAIVNGERNVLQALNSITPFAFALGPRNWSPIVSDIKITPGERYDAEQILEYDPQLQKITTIGTLVKIKPYSEFFATVAHFRLQDDPALQPLSNQVRALFGYGSLNRKGFNATAGISYDITNSVLQNQIAQINYNGACCGLAFEYRRINLGQVRTENQFRVAFIIANLGTFGNLRRQEKIF